MVQTEKDEKWKFLAIELAAREMLERDMELDLDKMFTRAKMIYEHGYLEDVLNWKSVFIDEKTGENMAPKIKADREKREKEEAMAKKKPAPIKKELKKVVAPPQQTDKVACPKCGDMISAKWKQHLVGSKGKCGWGVPEVKKDG